MTDVNLSQLQLTWRRAQEFTLIGIRQSVISVEALWCFGQAVNHLKTSRWQASFSHIPPTPLEPIVDGEGTPIVAQNNRPIAYTQENPGFVIVYEIKNATKLIDANPIGFKLPIEQES